MKIGIDIDGVLNRRQEFVMAYGAKFCVERGLTGLQSPDEYSLRKMYGWTEEERNEFWWQYAKYQMWVWPAQSFAAEVIKKLRKDGHEIQIVTGRNNDDMRVEGMPANKSWEEVTVDWLRKNEIVYDKIEFHRGGSVPNDKGTYCAEQGIDVMIEDLPEYLETLVGKTRIMVFDQPYNRKIELPNMWRVYSWYDIYNKIKELEK